jgi:ABC-type Fe3+ transport system permease subunit
MDARDPHHRALDRVWIQPAISGSFTAVLWTLFVHFQWQPQSHQRTGWIPSVALGLAVGLAMFVAGMVTKVVLAEHRQPRQGEGQHGGYVAAPERPSATLREAEHLLWLVVVTMSAILTLTLVVYGFESDWGAVTTARLDSTSTRFGVLVFAGAMSVVLAVLGTVAVAVYVLLTVRLRRQLRTKAMTGFL